MAKLTYKGVDAPNWNITGGLALANATLGNALKGFSDSLGDFREADQANADAILRERMLGLKTEDDFYKAFDEYVKLCREKLNDIINYKSLGDQFTFKNSIINTTFELKDKNSLSNKVLAVLKTKEE